MPLFAWLHNALQRRSLPRKPDPQCRYRDAFQADLFVSRLEERRVLADPSGADATLNVLEDATLTLQVADFGFTDPDGDTLQDVQISTLPADGTLRLNGVAVAQSDFITAADINANLLTFDPVADANGTPYTSFTFQVRDSANEIDGSANTITVNVTAVNDAPVLADNVVTLNAVAEDAAAPSGAVGTLVSSLVDFPGGGGQDNVTDVDAGAVTGIAITAADATNGTWWYTIDGGTSWLALGAVANNSARVLSADAGTRICFQPNANFNGTVDPAITFRVWDQTDGSANGMAGVDTTTNGGTTAFSTATDTASQSVTAVNDAPVLDNAGTMTLTTITEADTSNGGDLVSAIIASAGGDRITDVDSGAVEGIAITATAVNTGTGTWQFSTDNGGSWANIGAVSDNSALLLRAADRVRFVPDGMNAATGTITFRAWDQTGTTAGQQGTKQDASTNGGTAPYSTANETADVTVTAMNDAPVLADTVVALGAVAEDAGPPVGAVGTLVSSLVDFPGGGGQDNVTDVDALAATGIAVTAADTANGTWWYTIDGGANWLALGAVANNSARILAADGNTRLYFQANANFNGTVTAAVTFRAWDQTSGSNGDAGVDTTTNGGTTAFSTASDTASQAVTAVNDAPVLDNTGTMTLTTITEEQTNNSGDLVSAIIASAGGDRITDVDAGAVEGIAITATAVNTGAGTWEFSTDNGGSWFAIGAVASNSALLLRAVDRVRFVPDAMNAATGTITFHAWDQTGATAGQQGTKQDASTTGGATPYSAATETADITVTAVNDAPVLDNTGTMTLTTLSEDDINNSGDLVSAIIASAGGDRITDVDSGALEGIAITSTNVATGSGTWQYSTDNGGSWTDIGMVSNGNSLLLRAVDRVRFVPDGMGAATGSITFRAWDQSSGTAGTKVGTGSNGGTTAFSTATETAGITVLDANDAPVLDNSGAMTLTTINEDQTTNSGDLVSAIIASAGGDRITDADAGAVEGIAITATAVNTGSGTWEFSTDNGGSWTAIGVVADNSALLLRAVDRVRFVPDGLNAATGTITFRAWDQTGATAGQQGTKQDASTNGGTTPYSTATETAGITVTAINDAPVLDNTGTMSLTTINEDDTNNSGDLVSAIIASAGGDRITDVDNGALEGIAITATAVNTGVGTWEFSTDNGGSWTAIGAVAGNSALLLRAIDRVRFVPDGMNAATGTITFRAWDQSGATAGQQGTKQDASTNGGTTPFSTATETADITVADVNDAPVLDNTGTMTLTTIDEDNTTNNGDLVSAIIASAGGDRITDMDAGAVEGVAITATAVNTGSGTWEFSTDNGGSWTAIGAVANNSALLLRAVDRVRFVPDTMNAATGTITFRAWDQTGATAGQQGTKQDASTNGGATPYSTATETAAITVTAVNDAPVLDNSGTMTLTTITEDQINNSGDLVSAIIASAGGDRITDVDNGAVEGIAITAAVVNTGTGTWQFSTDNGGSWAAIGAVADNSALLLRATDRVRFVPDAIDAATGTITFRAWDQTGATAGQQGTKQDATTNGGTTPYSTAAETAGITVTAINDEPTLTATPLTPTYTEDTPAELLFNTTAINLVESFDNVQTLTLTVANLQNGANEVLVVDGTDVVLTNGNTVTTGANSYMANVAVAGGTATVTITRAGNITVANAQALVDGLRYRNDSQDPTGIRDFGGGLSPTRTVTLTSIQDTGGTTPGDDTGMLNVAATVTIMPVNDAPTVGLVSFIVDEDQFPGVTFQFNADDVDNHPTTLFYPGAAVPAVALPPALVPFAAAFVANYANLGGGGFTIPTPGDGFQHLAQGETATITFLYSVSDPGGLSSGMANVTITVNGLNDAPVITMSVFPSAGINEGENAHFEGVVSDLDFSDAHAVDVVFGDGGSASMGVATSVAGDLSARTGTFVIDHVYLDDPNGDPADQFHPQVDALDNHSGVATWTEPVQVRNLNPAFVIITAQDISSDGVARIAGLIQDPGVLDVMTITIDWRDPFFSNSDPATAQTTTLTVTLNGGQGAFTAEHRYVAGQNLPPELSENGTRVVIDITASDGDGGQDDAQVKAQLAGTGLGSIPFDVTPETPQIVFELPSVNSVPTTVFSLAELIQLIDFRTGQAGPSQGSNEQLVLKAINPDGTEKEEDIVLGRENERPEDVLRRLPEIFKKLTDGEYRIYLKREDGTRRLVLNVILRRHKQIDPAELKKKEPPAAKDENGEPKAAQPKKKEPESKLEKKDAGPKLNAPNQPESTPVKAPKPADRKTTTGLRPQDLQVPLTTDQKGTAASSAVAAIAAWAGVDGIRRWQNKVDDEMIRWSRTGWMERRRRLARTRRTTPEQR